MNETRQTETRAGGGETLGARPSNIFIRFRINAIFVRAYGMRSINLSITHNCGAELEAHRDVR
jgi:hypothetical protein